MVGGSRCDSRARAFQARSEAIRTKAAGEARKQAGRAWLRPRDDRLVTMATSWLSVIIPTYNGEAYLASALDSVAVQNDRDIECLIIDDGSDDATVSIIHSFKNKLPITLIHQSRTGNWVHNTNRALSQARADFVCFLHQDDLWLGTRLNKMKEVIRRYPGCRLFLHPSWYIDHRGRYLGRWRCPLPSYPRVVDTSLLRERLLIQNFISIPAPIFQRELALAIEGLDERLWYTADWDFWLRLAEKTKAVYHPEPLTAFRLHPNSQTIRRSTATSNFRDQLQLVLERHLTAQPSVDATIADAARFSIDVNVALASAAHGGPKDFLKLVTPFMKLGPAGWHRYFRDSRILERVRARTRAGLG